MRKRIEFGQPRTNFPRKIEKQKQKTGKLSGKRENRITSVKKSKKENGKVRLFEHKII